MKFFGMLVFISVVSCSAPFLFAADYTVTKVTDTNDGTCDADCSLREAVGAANGSVANDTVYFALPLFASDQTITLSGTEIVVANNGSLTIYGTGANRLTISGNNASRILSSSANAVVNIHHLRFIGGNGVGAVNSGRGGAIYNVGGTMVIANSIFNQNSAANGGAINNAASTAPAVPANLTLINCSLSFNTSTSSGSALQNFSTSTLHLRNTTVTRNSTTSTGIAAALQANGTVTITNSTFSGNFAPSGTGGGVYYNGTSLIMTNSTIIGNSSSLGGGGLHRTGTNPTLIMRNSIVAINGGAAATPDAAGLVTSEGNNIIGNVGTSTGWVMSDLQNTDPHITPFGFYGGNPYLNDGVSNWTHALLSASPAINGGQNCVKDLTCVTNNPPAAVTTDERGAARADTVDIGAFEVNPAYTAILPSARLNQPYRRLIAVLVPSDFLYVCFGCTLPPGMFVRLDMNNSVVVEGTSAQTGAFNFVVRASDSMNSTAFINYQLNILNDLSKVPVSGRVIDASGSGISKATVVLTDQNGGDTRFAITNGFGNFYIADVPVGATYTAAISSKGYTSAPQTVTVPDALDNLNFIAQ